MTRVEHLLALAALSPDEAIVLHKPSNIFYLSGYTGEGLLVLAQGLRAIVTDFRYTEQAERQAPGFSVHAIRPGLSHEQAVAALLGEKGVSALRFEDDCVTVKGLENLVAAMDGFAFSPLGPLPEQCREIKDAGELDAIARACDISCQAFAYICGYIREGMSETQIKRALDYKMLELGAQDLAFSTIVASGENGSLPHAIPGARTVKKGDMITMDFGAKVDGYCADMTRTVALGKPSEQMRAVYDLVLRAQEAAEAAIRPGMRGCEVDAVARDMIYAAGYEGRFGHGLGHAVGIDIHENPRFSIPCQDVIRVGHVMTVEPGVYLPGVGGVRIENTCVVEENGARTLVHAPKELLIL